jgi:hypothetical protein
MTGAPFWSDRFRHGFPIDHPRARAMLGDLDEVGLVITSPSGTARRACPLQAVPVLKGR